MQHQQFTIYCNFITPIKLTPKTFDKDVWKVNLDDYNVLDEKIDLDEDNIYIDIDTVFDKINNLPVKYKLIINMKYGRYTDECLSFENIHTILNDKYDLDLSTKEIKHILNEGVSLLKTN